MVKGGFLIAVLSLTVALWAEDASGEGSPTLYGDGAGRVWKWSDGKKTDLTPASMKLVLGGMKKNFLWGWSMESAGARFFTLALPKKDSRPGAPIFDKGVYPVPDLADRLGDRLLLVYGAHTAPRWEVWQAGRKLAAMAYDDRSIYSVALGPKEGWLVAGIVSGQPWVNFSGTDVPPPEGWRGRLTLSVWLGGDNSPAIPLAAGWGTSGGSPSLLFWEPDGWSQPASEPEVETKTETETVPADLYPVVGMAGEQGLVLGGWQRSNGVTRPWFWDGKSEPPGKAADGDIQALSLAKGKALVVKHAAPPWFTLEDGKTSVVLEGLDEHDRAVAAEGETR